MQDTESTGATDQTSPVIIERFDGVAPSFFSRQVGRDFGQPLGGWTGDRALATKLDPDEAQGLLEGPFVTLASNCKTVSA